MKTKFRKMVGAVLVLAAVSLTGCTDGVRQTMTPYVFQGLQTIADGLLAGLEQAVYPEGTTTTAKEYLQN